MDPYRGSSVTNSSVVNPVSGVFDRFGFYILSAGKILILSTLLRTFFGYVDIDLTHRAQVGLLCITVLVPAFTDFYSS